MAVASGSIVEHLDVVEDICLGEISRSVDPFSTDADEAVPSSLTKSLVAVVVVSHQTHVPVQMT
jgi:hypothetical protein